MIVIVDYGMGNLRSVAKAFERVHIPVRISADLQEIRAASRLILPGVGHFGRGMEHLNARGFRELLDTRVREEGIPVLGICMGMQLFSSWGEEGECPGLGWVHARTIRFHFEEPPPAPRVPHMGWNQIVATRPHPLLEAIDPEASFYFAHSYHLTCESPDDVLATTTYGYSFPSIIQRGSMCAVQFHPEKSHRHGLTLLQNFARLPDRG